MRVPFSGDHVAAISGKHHQLFVPGGEHPSVGKITSLLCILLLLILLLLLGVLFHCFVL